MNESEWRHQLAFLNHAKAQDYCLSLYAGFD